MNILYIVLFIVYPLFMTDGYMNTTITKCISFAIITGIAFFLLAWKSYETYVIKHGGISEFSLKETVNNLSVSDRFGCAFIFASFVSFIFAKYRHVAFTGSSDSYLGFFTVIVLALVFWIASRYFRIDELFAIIVSVGGLMTAVFAIAQFMGADIFGLLAKTASDSDRIYNFLSTLGNTSVFGQYMVLIMPIAIIGYCKALDTRRRVLFMICYDIIFMGILVANVDVAYLGIIVICMLSAIMLWRKKVMFVRSVELLANMAGSIMVLKILYGLCADARGRSAITRAVLGFPLYVYIILIAVFAITAYIINKKINNNNFYIWMSRIAAILSIVMVIFGIVLFVYCSAINRNADFGRMEKYLRFNDHWGTDRGYVWRWLFTIFLDFDPIRKLIGAGQGSIVFELFAYYKTQMLTELKYYFDNAHNVYLHLLFTTGILGVGTYIGMIITSIQSGIKNALHENEYYWGIIISIFAYAVVDIFSVLQPITLGLYIIFIGIASSNCKK